MPFTTQFQLIAQNSNACTLISAKVLEYLLFAPSQNMTTDGLNLCVGHAGNEFIHLLTHSTNFDRDLTGVSLESALEYTPGLSWENQDCIHLSKPKPINQTQGLSEEIILALKQAFHARIDFGADINTWYEMCLEQILRENDLSYNLSLNESNEDEFLRNITLEKQAAAPKPLNLESLSNCVDAKSLLQSAKRMPPETEYDAFNTIGFLLSKLADRSGLILTAGGHTTFVARKESIYWAYNPATGILAIGTIQDAAQSIYNKLMAPDTTELSIYLVSQKLAPQPVPAGRPDAAASRAPA